MHMYNTLLCAIAIFSLVIGVRTQSINIVSQESVEFSKIMQNELVRKFSLKSSGYCNKK